jgi:Holliday junction resolvase RusA-like endonuclease
MKLFLPYPPSANDRLTARKGGKGFVNTTRYRAWMEHSAWVVALAMRDGKQQKIMGPYRLDMVAMPPLRSQVRDLDNIIKATSDALKKGGAVEDDRFCQMLRIGWGELDEAGVLVEIEPCRSLLLPVAGRDSSTSATEKPLSPRQSRLDVTTLDALIGGRSDTGRQGAKDSGSRPFSIRAANINSRKSRNNPKT